MKLYSDIEAFTGIVRYEKPMVSHEVQLIWWQFLLVVVGVIIFVAIAFCIIYCCYKLRNKNGYDFYRLNKTRKYSGIIGCNKIETKPIYNLE